MPDKRRDETEEEAALQCDRGIRNPASCLSDFPSEASNSRSVRKSRRLNRVPEVRSCHGDRAVIDRSRPVLAEKFPAPGQAV
ncbi:hypothetical protein SKAU_G00332920 [Synaphobranchus kaupii]|uniref:Uncharacterized protein n=1 Tax=Synaphobranchus kaupii TaxID=118154 RepID=A0A9Q1ELI8_SYNKA|nr:hypothetical protein SKAU_G00332920 [Synaphobranchus kaupii]